MARKGSNKASARAGADDTQQPDPVESAAASTEADQATRPPEASESQESAPGAAGAVEAAEAAEVGGEQDPPANDGADDTQQPDSESADGEGGAQQPDPADPPPAPAPAPAEPEHAPVPRELSPDARSLIAHAKGQVQFTLEPFPDEDADRWIRAVRELRERGLVRGSRGRLQLTSEGVLA